MYRGENFGYMEQYSNCNARENLSLQEFYLQGNQEHFGFSDFMGKASSKLDDICKDVKNFTSTGSISGLVVPYIDTAGNYLEDKMSGAFDFVKSGVNTVGNGVTFVTDNIGNAIGNSLQVLAQGVAEGIGGIDSLIGGLGGEVDFDPEAKNTANLKFTYGLKNFSNKYEAASYRLYFNASGAYALSKQIDASSIDSEVANLIDTAMVNAAYTSAIALSTAIKNLVGSDVNNIGAIISLKKVGDAGSAAAETISRNTKADIKQIYGFLQDFLPYAIPIGNRAIAQFQMLETPIAALQSAVKLVLDKTTSLLPSMTEQTKTKILPTVQFLDSISSQSTTILKFTSDAKNLITEGNTMLSQVDSDLGTVITRMLQDISTNVPPEPTLTVPPASPSVPSAPIVDKLRKVSTSLIILQDTIDLLTADYTSIGNVIDSVTVVNPSEVTTIDPNLSIAGSVPAISSAVATFINKLKTISTQMTTVINTTNTNITTVNADVNVDQAVATTALQNVSTAIIGVADAYNTATSDITTASNTFSTIVDNVKLSLSKYTGSDTAALASMQTFYSSIVTIKGKLSSSGLSAKSIQEGFTNILSIVAPSTESFDLMQNEEKNLPFTVTKKEMAGQDPINIYTFKDVPVTIYNQQGSGIETQLYRMDKILYYVQKTPDGSVVEYVEYPMPNMPDFQMYLYHVAGDDQPLAFSNYPIPGVVSQDLESLMGTINISPFIQSTMGVDKTVQEIKEGFGILDDIQSGIDQYVVSPVTSGFNTAISSVESAINYVMTPIKATAKMIKTVVWDCLYQNIKNFVAYLPNLPIDIYNIVRKTADKVIGTVTTVINGILGTVNTIKDNVFKIGSSIFKGVKGAWNGAVGVISNTVNGIIKTVKTIKNKIMQLIRFLIALPGKIWEKLKTVGNSIADTASGIYKKVKNAVLNAFNFEPYAVVTFEGYVVEEPKPWYKSKWFYAILLIVALVICWMMYKKYVKHR